MKVYILFSFLLLAVICSSSVDAQAKFGRLCSSHSRNIIRGCDRHGCGHYGAKRGKGKHMGLDITCADGATVYAPFDVKLNGRSRPYGNNNAIDNGINLSGQAGPYHRDREERAEDRTNAPNAARLSWHHFPCSRSNV